MKTSTLLILAGTLLLLAIFGTTLIVRQSPKEEPGKPKPAATASPDAERRDLGRALERIATLEAELEKLRGAQARSDKLLQALMPVAEQVESARKQALTSGGNSGEEPRAFSTSMMGPQAVADLLGIVDVRKGEFKRVFDETVEKIRALESARAKVSVDGNKTRIEIPAFAPEAEALYSGWLQWARGFFTPAEKDTFNQQRLFDSLFGFKRGVHDRVILLERPGDGTVSVHETDAGGSSGRFNGPEETSALGTYAHLLKKK